MIYRMNRRQFLQSTALAVSTVAVAPNLLAQEKGFPIVRVPESKRKFRSAAVEKLIERVQSAIGNKELAWMFGNCFPNTLDTTVDFSMIGGRPDTYVITGDIDAMWLRDSSVQVWPYLPLMREDSDLQQLIAGIINRQTRCILLDPYANAFYKDTAKVSPWKNDFTEMKPGIHERKWEVDSLCYPIRLAHGYWRTGGDTAPFDATWRDAMKLVLQTFREQQRKSGVGPYRFERSGFVSTDSCPGYGWGNPVNPVGMIASMFRPSDDATIFPFLVPSNFFAVTSLRQCGEMLEQIYSDKQTAAKCRNLAAEIETALQQHAIVKHPQFGKIFAFEVDGYGGHCLMDDANIPGLVSLPYFSNVKTSDETYRNTRRFALSKANPYFWSGKAGEGIGSPHQGADTIWQLGYINQAMTSTDDTEIRRCLKALQQTHAHTGYIHETFHKDDASKFTRAWFAFANTLFGELVLKIFNEKRALLDEK
jgi:meiotically up-regulated gene 157 (Mug157) protein